ncbi:hypothetical protein McPS_29080 [Marichromatium sp. PS1]
MSAVSLQPCDQKWIQPAEKAVYKCQDCGRQFVLYPAKGPVSQETRELIDRLLLEKISLAGIARAVKVSEAWLQNYVNEKYKKVPRHVALKKTPHPTE